METLDERFARLTGRSADATAPDEENLGPLEKRFREKQREASMAASMQPPTSLLQNVKDIGLTTPLYTDMTVEEGLKKMKKDVFNILKIYPVVEAGLNVGGQMAGMSIAGVAGLGAMAPGGKSPIEAYTDVSKKVEEAVYQPKTQAGQELTESVAGAFDTLNKVIRAGATPVAQSVQDVAEVVGLPKDTAIKAGGATQAAVETVVNALLGYETLNVPIPRIRGPKPSRPLTEAEMKAPTASLEEKKPVTGEEALQAWKKDQIVMGRTAEEVDAAIAEAKTLGIDPTVSDNLESLGAYIEAIKEEKTAESTKAQPAEGKPEEAPPAPTGDEMQKLLAEDPEYAAWLDKLQKEGPEAAGSSPGLEVEKVIPKPEETENVGTAPEEEAARPVVAPLAGAEPTPMTSEILARQELPPAERAEAEKEPLPPPSSKTDEFTAALAEFAAAKKELEKIETEDTRLEAVISAEAVEPKPPTPEDVQVKKWEDVGKLEEKDISEGKARTEQYAQDIPQEHIPHEELPIIGAVKASAQAKKALKEKERTLQQLQELPTGTYLAGGETVLFPGYWHRAAAELLEPLRAKFMPDARLAVVAALAKEADLRTPRTKSIGFFRPLGDFTYAIGPRPLIYFDEIRAGRQRQRNIAGQGILQKFGKYNELAQIQAQFSLYHEFGHALLHYYADKMLGSDVYRNLADMSRRGLIGETVIADLPEQFQPVVREFNRIKREVNEGRMSLRQWLQEGAGIWRNAEITYLQRMMKQAGLKLDVDAPGSAKEFFDRMRQIRGVDYELSLPEYIAEQASRYGYSKNWEHGTRVGTKRFFAGAVKLLREYFKRLKLEEVLAPSTSFVDWLESFGNFKQKLVSEMGKGPVEAAQKVPKKTKKKVVEALKAVEAPPEVLTPEVAEETPKVEVPPLRQLEIKEIDGLPEADHAKNLRREVMALAKDIGAAPTEPIIKEYFQLIRDGQFEEVARRLSEYFNKSIEYDDVMESNKEFEPGRIAVDMRTGEQVQLTGKVVQGVEGSYIEATLPDGSSWMYAREAIAILEDVPGEHFPIDVTNTISVLATSPIFKKKEVTKQELEALLKNPQFKQFDKTLIRYAMRKAPAAKGKYKVAALKDEVNRMLVPFEAKEFRYWARRGFMEAMDWLKSITTRYVGEGSTMVARESPFEEVHPTALTNIAPLGDIFSKRFTPMLSSVGDVLRGATGAVRRVNNKVHGAGSSLGWVRALYRDVKLQEDGPLVSAAFIGEVQSDIIQQAKSGRSGMERTYTGAEYIAHKVEIIAEGLEYAVALKELDLDAPNAVERLYELLGKHSAVEGALRMLASRYDSQLPEDVKNTMVQELVDKFAEDYPELVETTPLPEPGVDGPYRTTKLLHQAVSDRQLEALATASPKESLRHQLNNTIKNLEIAIEFAEKADRPLDTAEAIAEQAVYQLYENLSSNPYLTLLSRAIVEMKAERPGLQAVLLGPGEWLTRMELWGELDSTLPQAQTVLRNWDLLRKAALQRYKGAVKLDGDWVYIDVSDKAAEIYYDDLDLAPTAKLIDVWRSMDADFKKQAAALNRMKMTYLQVQQLAHLYPGVKHLEGATRVNSKYNRTKGYLHEPGNAALSAWQKTLGKEYQSFLGRALQREYEEGVHWTNLVQVPRRDKTPGLEWRHEPAPRMLEELRKDGIKVDTPAGKIAVGVYLEVKNAILHQLNYLERVLVKIADRAGRDPMEYKWIVKQIRETPFFPQTRFGNYIIEVKNKDGVIMRQAFESIKEWDKAKEKVSRGLKAGEVMRDYIVSETAGHLQIIPNEFIDAVAQALELNEEQIKEISGLMDSFKSMKALRQYDRALARIKGANADPIRRFGSYIWHNGNLIAKMETNSHFRALIRDLEAQERLLSTYRPGDLKDVPLDELNKTRYGINLAKNAIESMRNYVMYPPNEAQALRSLMTGVYLMANVKAAVVNISGFIMTASDLLARLGPIKGTAKIIESPFLLGQLMLGKLPEHLKAAYDRAKRENVLQQSYAYHLAGVANPHTLDRLFGNNAFARTRMVQAFDTMMYAFRLVEEGTRTMTFLAEMDILLKQGMKFEEAYTEAVRLTDLLQNNYSFGNRPVWMRGTKTKSGGLYGKIVEGFVPTLTLFLSWLQHMTFHAYGGYEIGMRRRASLQNIKRPGSYTAYFMLMTLGLAGIMGLPGAEDLMTLASAAARKWWGRDLKTDLRNLIQDMDADPYLWMHGVSSAVPTGWGSVDVSGSIGLGRIMPGMDVLTGTEKPSVDGVLETLPAGALFKWVTESLWGLATENATWREVGYRAPGAIGNATKAYDWWAKKGFYNIKGDKLLDREPTMADLLGQSLGFTPTDVRKATAMHWDILEAQYYWQERRNTQLNKLWKATVAGDREGIADVKRDIERFNKLVPFKEFKITSLDQAQSMARREKMKEKREEIGTTVKRYEKQAKAIIESYKPPQ